MEELKGTVSEEVAVFLLIVIGEIVGIVISTALFVSDHHETNSIFKEVLNALRGCGRTFLFTAQIVSYHI